MGRETSTAETHVGNNVFEIPIADGNARTVKAHCPREGKLWLFAAFLMFVTGLFKGINLLVLLSYLLTGTWIVNWRLVRRDLKKISGRRMKNSPIFAGTPSALQMEIACGDGRPARGMTIVDRGPAHHREWLILNVSAGQPARIRWQQVFPRRGRYAVESLRAFSRFPFGLISRSSELSPAEEWIVLPRLGIIHSERLKQWLAQNARGDGRMRRRRLQPALQEADIHGLREFRAGDSPRWIHWRSSARRNQLLVREFEDSSPPDLLLIVEPWLPDNAGAKENVRLESLISLAATLCNEWCRDAASRLTLAIRGREPVILGASSGREFGLKTMEALAIADGRAGIPAERWFDRLPRMSPSTPVLILTSRPSSPLPDETAGYCGRAVAVVQAGDAVVWYDAPVDPSAS